MTYDLPPTQESRTIPAGYKVTPTEKAILHRLRDALGRTEADLLRNHSMAELMEMHADLEANGSRALGEEES